MQRLPPFLRRRVLRDVGTENKCGEVAQIVREQYVDPIKRGNRSCRFFHLITGRSYNGRFLRHRFSPKPKVIATQNSLPKRNHVAKEAVSAAWQTKTRQRSERIRKPNDAPRAKPRPCVNTMLCDAATPQQQPAERSKYCNYDQQRKLHRCVFIIRHEIESKRLKRFTGRFGE